MIFYLDTNVFFYATQVDSSFYQEASMLLEQAFAGKVTAYTSLETIQEIIHVAKKVKRTKQGVRICQTILANLPNTVDINRQITKTYLALIKQKRAIDSRDCIHIATCIDKKIPFLVTEDKDLRKIKIKGVTVISIKKAVALLG